MSASTTISDYTTKLALVVKDDASRFTTANKEDFVEAAVRQYSRDRPRTLDAKLVGDGSTQAFPPPVKWVQDFSVIQRLEYEIDEVPPSFLDLDDNLMVVRRNGSDVILLTIITLDAGEHARIYYTAPHTVDSNEDTVPDNDFDAVVWLAASALCMGLAAFYAESTDSTLVADVINHERKATLFSDLGVAYERKYREHIGLPLDGGVEKAAMVLHDIDVDYSWGRDLLYHPRRHR